MVEGTKVGRVVVGPVLEDTTKTRPHYFKVTTMDLNGDPRLVEFRRSYHKLEAVTARTATISQLKSARKARRKAKP